jgi:cytochrome P450
VEFDPLSDDFFNGAFETYRWLRNEAPVYRNDTHNFWALSRYEDVQPAYKDWTTYSSASGIMLDQLNIEGFNGPAFMPGFLGVYDPPLHTRLRRLVSQAFTPKGVRSLERNIEQSIRRHLDALSGREEFDFVDDFAQRFPAEVIYDLMGVPEPDRERHWHLSDQFMYAGDESEEGLFNPVRINAMQELMQYFLWLTEEKREHPCDDMITRMTQSSYVDDDGVEQRLTDQEMAAYLLQTMAAGVETTTKLLSGAMVSLNRNPADWEKILESPEKIPGALEEQGRLEAPVQFLGRKSTTDVTLHGVTIPAKSNVLLLIGSANRDERVFPVPDRYDIERAFEPAPMTWGGGPHLCIGVHLARFEGQMALEAIRERWPRFEIDEAGLRRARGFHVFGWSRVPVSVRPSVTV